MNKLLYVGLLFPVRYIFGMNYFFSCVVQAKLSEKNEEKKLLGFVTEFYVSWCK